MYHYIEESALEIQDELYQLRMQFHAHPETAWQEINTTQIIQQYLENLGYETVSGPPVAGHETGTIAILRLGKGPTLAFRFDIDGLPVTETTNSNHLPYQEGFRSRHEGIMHACGHDGHITIGLGCAKLISKLQAHLHGTIKLIFQPAEEGARGAAPIVERGWLDDVDYFLSAHIFNRPNHLPESCNVITGVSDSFATTKSDVHLYGLAAHAAHPEQGRDVIPAIAEIICKLKTVSAPGFIHIGTITAGCARNIIADHGKLELETRAPSTQRNQELNDYLKMALDEITISHQITYDLEITGNAPSVESTPAFAEALRQSFLNASTLLHPADFMIHFPASEDVSHMINKVKENGGNASFMLFPAKLSADLHHSDFDFPASVLTTGVVTFTHAAYHLLADTE